MQQTHTASTFLKGMGLGLAVGSAAACAGKMLMKDKHNITKGTGKMVEAVGDFIDGIQTLFK